MSKKVFIALLFLLSGQLFSQENPVSWEAKQVTEGKNQYIVVTANMIENWHIYSMNLKEEFGPVPTTITFSDAENVEYLGKIEQGKPKRAKDLNFDMIIDYFDGTADFKQKIKVSAETIVKVSIYYMCCDDKRCFPPKEEIIEITLK